MPWLEDLKFPRGYQMGTHKKFLDMDGYENLEELFKSTKKSFRNLIHENQREAVEASIWN